ncbi:MAG: class E sortase [Clostridia bacterium]|nr:MAG: class E sortase [Clostridia bacterium]
MSRFKFFLRAGLIVGGAFLLFVPLLMEAYAEYWQEYLHVRASSFAEDPVMAAGRKEAEGQVDGGEGATSISRDARDTLPSPQPDTDMPEAQSSREVLPSVPVEQRQESVAPDGAGAPDAWPPTIVVVPKLDLWAAVVHGVSPKDLRRGPGHYPDSAWPPETGNVAIAGHRTTYGAWFRHLDKLEAGDTIYLVSSGRTYCYRVEKVWVTEPTDWSVVAPTANPVLTLTTCNPLYSSRQRLVVRASMVSPAMDNW